MMRSSILRGLVCLAWALSSGCASLTATLYQGNERSEAEMGRLVSFNTKIVLVDAHEVLPLRGDQIFLPPGPHIIDVLDEHFDEESPARLCLMVEEGHSYRTLPRFRGTTWSPILEDSARGIVPSDCSTSRLFPDDESDESEAAEADASPNKPVEPIPSESATAVTASSAEAIARVFQLRASTPVKHRRARPVLAFGANTGFSFPFGNNNFVGGGGYSLGLEGKITPVWLWTRVGLGFGGQMNFKGDSFTLRGADAFSSGPTYDFHRYPAIGTLHLLLRTTEQWFMLFEGGIEKDFGISLSRSDLGSGSEVLFTTNTGKVARFGMFVQLTDSTAATFGTGFTSLEYSLEGGALRFDANSVNFWASVLWTPQPATGSSRAPTDR